MAYKGKFTTFENPDKYIGDKENVIYRSLWERNVMRWLDTNPNIVEWGSEEMSITYDHPVRGGTARYFPDFIFKHKNGEVKVIEVKPFKQTREPGKQKRQTQQYVESVMTYAVNQDKWKAAKEVCLKNNIVFEIWTEVKLKKLGILNWETDKGVLLSESKNSNKPKMQHLGTKRKPRPRPKRKS